MGYPSPIKKKVYTQDLDPFNRPTFRRCCSNRRKTNDNRMINSSRATMTQKSNRELINRSNFIRDIQKKQKTKTNENNLLTLEKKKEYRKLIGTIS